VQLVYGEDMYTEQERKHRRHQVLECNEKVKDGHNKRTEQ